MGATGDHSRVGKSDFKKRDVAQFHTFNRHDMTDYSNKGDKILSLPFDRLIIKSTGEVTLNGNFNFMG